jgi:hypothetical protein
MTKKLKLKKRFTLKKYGGRGFFVSVKLVPPENELEMYDVKDSYEKMIKSLEKNLNLYFLPEEKIDGESKKGCFNYLMGMITDLTTRRLVERLKDQTKVQTDLDNLLNEINEIKTNFERLKESFNHDKEIVFHIIIGCIQSLQVLIVKTFKFITQPGCSFPQYQEYLEQKRNRFEDQVKKIKVVMNQKDNTQFSLKIENNIGMYELWKKNMNTPIEELKIPDTEIDNIINPVSRIK